MRLLLPSHIQARILIISLFIISGLPYLCRAQTASQTHGAAQQELEQLLREIEESDALKHGHLGFALSSPSEEKILCSVNLEKCFIPASVMKLFSSGLALMIIGPDFRYETDISVTGIPVIDGVMHGDLIIIGSGDPSIGSSYIDLPEYEVKLHKEIARSLHSKGIHIIDGSIILLDTLYDSELVSPYWNWLDIGNYYCSPVSSINFADNQFSLSLNSGKMPGGPTVAGTIDPSGTGISIRNKVRSGAWGSGDEAYFFAAPGDTIFNLRGSIPPAKNGFKLRGALPDPAVYLGQTIKSYLEAHEIVITGKVEVIKDKAELEDFQYKIQLPILKYQSPNLSELIKLSNQKSINLYAEAIAKTVLLHENIPADKPSEPGFLSLVEKQGISPEGLFIADASGLSRENLVTPLAIISLLDLMQKQDTYDIFYESLPVSGTSGTMFYTGRSEELRGKVHAKTGTMRGVKAYAGYIEADSGLLSFVILYNQIDAVPSEIRAMTEKIFGAIIKF